MPGPLPAAQPSRRRTAVTILGGFVLIASVAAGWFVWQSASSRTSSVSTSSTTASGGTLGSADEDGWILGSQVANGNIRAYYLLQGRTFKIKFVNDEAAAELKYRLKGEVKVDNRWGSFFSVPITIRVLKGEPKFDNMPVATEKEEFRNMEIEIVDWNYL